jgi:N-acetylmuramoyl-L-alanine amidase
MPKSSAPPSPAARPRRAPVARRSLHALVRTGLAAALATGLAACAAAPRAPAAPAGSPDPGTGLPPVPRAAGAPLGIRVVSPSANASVGSRDSTFVFGQVGSGDATLTINGAPVEVAPNGAFLAFLPVPPAGAARYELVATRGAETARLTVPVRLPAGRRALPATGPLRVDTASLSPAGRRLVLADERVRVGVRAPRNATVWLVPARGAGPVTSLPTRDSTRTAAELESVPGRPVPEERLPLVDVGPASSGDDSTDAATVWARDVSAVQLVGVRPAQLVVARGADTVRLSVRAPETLEARSPAAAVDRPGVVQLGRVAAVPDTDRVVVGRPVPGGTYRWFFLPGTVVQRTGARDGYTRVRLDAQLEAWVDDDDVTPLPAGYPLPRRVAGAARVVPAAEWVDLVVPLADRPPYEVVERGDAVELVLYGTVLTPEILPIRGTAADSLVRQVLWAQEANDRARITLRLSRAPYGYLVLWERGALVLRLRRPPRVEPARPLAGLTIAVDAGHPPGGATGPTGLWEPVAVLPVAERVRALLEARGARVLMTRTTAAAVGLTERAVAARRADAHAFVSVHLNAFPDGVNPFTNNGTSVLFFQQHSEPLARAVQAQLVRRLGLRDLGIHYQNLAVARPPWMPAILTEGLFLMVPEQEAALRSVEGRERYARGIVDGVEDYFRALGQGR